MKTSSDTALTGGDYWLVEDLGGAPPSVCDRCSDSREDFLSDRSCFFSLTSRTKTGLPILVGPRLTWEHSSKQHLPVYYWQSYIGTTWPISWPWYISQVWRLECPGVKTELEEKPNLVPNISSFVLWGLVVSAFKVGFTKLSVFQCCQSLLLCMHVRFWMASINQFPLHRHSHLFVDRQRAENGWD